MGGLYPGSSPLTRGKQIGEVGGGFDGGLIPAHAGKTPRRAGQAWRAGAHPRSRGENNRGPTGDLSPLGSSPLTRGKQGEDLDHAASSGLIPAHAGKTSAPTRSYSEAGAHPRSRGENTRLRAARTVSAGSSPLTRGKHLPQPGRTAPQRLIPAHAGKTDVPSTAATPSRAHPRSRGENSPTGGATVSSEGSSPLTRGKLYPSVQFRALRGLIPAHAGKTRSTASSTRSPPAHPRSRGENRCACLGVRVVPGSSPLTRGKRELFGADAERRGLIPAHAGKTVEGGAHEVRLPAHPRSRGENGATMDKIVALVGSSPLTRGKREGHGRAVSLPGLIPAHAGKTVWPVVRGQYAQAHPRSRGENRDVGRVRRTGQGSSPLTRGKRPASVYLVVFIGLIPAHAGKTVRESTTQNVPWAHPRSRGENLLRWLRVRVARGSSPLTRGKLVTCRAARRCRGLIPAHAGKTWRRGAGRPTRRAHPRSRGENRSTSSFSAGAAGSSPLTRGKPHTPRPSSRASRLIPAHAGKTTGRQVSRSAPWAHPRSRGENTCGLARADIVEGSSPLTRGKPLHPDSRAMHRGLIPAHAGKTSASTSRTQRRRAHPRSRGENSFFAWVSR